MRYALFTPFGYFACLIVVVSALSISYADPPSRNEGVGPTNSDSSTPPAVDPTALSKLKDILSGPNNRLRLSTEKSSAAEPFYLLLKLEPGGGKADRSVNTLIARDGDKVLVLVRSRLDRDVLPCCIATNGIAVGLDPTKPGGIVVSETATPLIYFVTKKDGTLSFGQGLQFEEGQRPRVSFDAASILEAAMPKIVDATYDAEKDTVLVHTKTGATLRVQPARRGADVPFALRELTVSTQSVGISMYVLGSRPEKALDPWGATPERVAALHLPERAMTADDAAVLFVAPPAAFHSDREHRAVAEKLALLLTRAPRKD